MGKDKVDLRIIKTRRAIKEAFLSLIQSKGYERITVQDIADKAMINRNTFYLHYVDKPDLMEFLCKESVDKLNVCFNLDLTDIHKMDNKMLIFSLTRMFEVIEEDILFFKIMLSQNGQLNFSSYLKEALKRFILSDMNGVHQNQRFKISMEYMISGLVGVICMWVTDPELLVLEEVIEQLSEIHFHNVSDLLKTL
ncbi:TetR/AcrR family transcriptional regulator [Paenibacillus camerounensis]|uniref:TetR/AcrR family transcriptional regulator n=1 Tax=Paenibacillus camerounensis TaxID=1243663 RepID=UPI0005A95C26|nr:TetR/AcrR family transcriptional regulator [Paenibacillus camerounensis]